jgi:O-antigen ligase
MLLKVLFTVWAVSLSLGQVMSVGRSTFGGVYVFDFVACFWALLTTVALLVSKKHRFVVPRIYLWAIGFVFWALLSLLSVSVRYTVLELSHSFFYLFRFGAYVYGGFLVYIMLRNGLFSLDFVYKVLVFTLLLLVFLGVIQLFLLPDFSMLDSSLGWDPHKNRLASTFMDPNFLGAYLVLGLNLILSFRKKHPVAFWPLSLVIVTAILLTFSRSAWLMLGITALFWGAFRYRVLLLLSVLLAFGAYYAVPRVQTRISGTTDPADSAHYRIVSWRRGLEIFGDSPLLGVGFNTLRYEQKNRGFFGADWGGHSGGGVDSSLILVLAAAGVPGLLLFVGFYVGMFGDLGRSLMLCFVSATVSLLAGSFFINSLFYPQIFFFWNVLLASVTFSCTRQ